MLGAYEIYTTCKNCGIDGKARISFGVVASIPLGIATCPKCGCCGLNGLGVKSILGDKGLTVVDFTNLEK